MMQQTVHSERLHERFVRVEHASGLTMLLCPMEGTSSVASCIMRLCLRMFLMS